MDAQAMMNSYFATHDLVLYVLGASVWLTIGVFMGAFHFLTLRWNVKMLTVGQSLTLALATQFIRFALIAGMLAAIAGHFGALPLLTATAGILAARTAAVQLGAQP
jgi:F1F0 ATPase subunit 2